MPRIIVTTDPVASELTGTTPVLLEEHVHSVHLSTGHAAAQLVQRLAWAISDAEHAEDAEDEQPARERRPRTRRPVRVRQSAPYTQHAIRA